MKPPRLAALLLAALCAAPGCGSPSRTIVQISTIGALLAGAYDGSMTCRELRRHGDFGLGTFDRLDGEMVVLDGTVYQVRADGGVRAAGPGEKTPYAMVTRFSPSLSVPLARGAGLPELEASIDRAFPDMNLFCAVRVRGRFSEMRTRSVPPQEKPYPPLAEAAKAQAVFRRRGVSGTLVGFRAPAYAERIAPPGHHLHFLSDDRTFGGHVLAFSLESGSAELEPCRRFLLLLPPEGSSFGTMDLGGDRGGELEKVERGRGPTR